MQDRAANTLFLWRGPMNLGATTKKRSGYGILRMWDFIPYSAWNAPLETA